MQLRQGRALDITIFRAINLGLTDPALDLLFSRVGYALGTYQFSLALFSALFLTGHRRPALVGLRAVATGALLVALSKYVVRRPRPAMILPGVREVGMPAPMPAFPSGHAEQAFLTAYLLAGDFPFHRHLPAVLYGLAAFVGLSRIYAGEHLPSDVVAGALTGLLWGALWAHPTKWLDGGPTG